MFFVEHIKKGEMRIKSNLLTEHFAVYQEA